MKRSLLLILISTLTLTLIALNNKYLYAEDLEMIKSPTLAQINAKDIEKDRELEENTAKAGGNLAKNEADIVEKSEPLILKTGKLASSHGKIVGTNGITLVKGEIKITAEKLTYYEEKKKAEISDKVILIHENGEISSNSMEAWLTDDKYIFREEVVMVQNLSTGKFNLTSPYLELAEAENSFQASQGVVIEYNGRTLKGENAFYNEEEQLLELANNVYIEEDNGDWVSGDRALFYLETEEFTVEGEVELEIAL